LTTFARAALCGRNEVSHDGGAARGRGQGFCDLPCRR
jgi:hypothetical protein